MKQRRQYDVVRVIARLNIGGPALHVMHLSERLADRYSTLLVTGNVAPGEADLLDEARARGIAVHQIPELGRAVRAGQDVVALRKLVSLLRQVQPAIVHTHTAKAGTLGRMAGLLTRVPRLVHTFHGHVFDGYFNRTMSRGITAVERTLAYGTDRIVAISELQAAELTARYHVCRRERVSVIPLGLDLSAFLNGDHAQERAAFRQELQLGNEPVVTIVGRLVPIKNHDLFLAAAARVLAQRADAVFVVVGDGADRP
ncbi:MAG TPA: glycosyltransferase, partial [Longimicrobiales bacterium]